MAFRKINTLVSFVLSIFSCFCSCEPWYKTFTKPLNSITSKDLYTVDNERYLSADATKVTEFYISEQKTSAGIVSIPKYMNNLDAMLENLADDKCLIVVNNFVGTEIKMKVPIPVILRRFELAIHYGATTNIIWTPAEYLPELNYTDSHHCHISTKFASLNHKSGYCVGLSQERFSSLSKPWLCEVQVDLFMPDSTFRLGKHTQIFRCGRCHTISSSMPKINILVNTEKSVKEYSTQNVATWMSRDSWTFLDDSSYIQPVSDFLIFSYTYCKTPTNLLMTSICQITNLSILFPCAECKHLYLQHILSFKLFNIDYIRVLDEKI